MGAVRGWATGVFAILHRSGRWGRTIFLFAAAASGGATTGAWAEAPATRVIGASADASISRLFRDSNAGGALQLRVAALRPERSLTRFLLEPPDQRVQRAVLTLTLAAPVTGWGTEGFNLVLHRLQPPWTEGQGPDAIAPGVTWDCATDTRPGNRRPDCSKRWHGGLLGAATARARVVPSQTGEVSWDVTADVLGALAAGSPDLSWIVRVEGEHEPSRRRRSPRPDRALFHSREGAGQLGDPRPGPRLTLELDSPPPPQVDAFTSNPESIAAGQSSQLAWSTSHATSVSIDNGVGSGLSTSGSATVSPAATTTYTLTAAGPGGTASDSLTVTVVPAPTVPSFVADPATIQAGQSSTLAWTTENAASVSIDNGVGGSLPLTGSVAISPAATTTYTLTATGPGGAATAAATVTVSTTPNLPPTAGDDSASTTEDLPIDVPVLANDLDPDFDVLTVTSVAAPPGGAVTLRPNGVVAYTPSAGFVGTDAFTYDIEDGKGGSATGTVTVTVGPAPPTRIETSPSNGAGDVAVTRETIVRFARPLQAGETIGPDELSAEFGGQRLTARVHTAADRRSVTLFYDRDLPPSARVRVTFVGDGVLDDKGRPIDADGDGVAGGTALVDFDTLTLTTLPGTAAVGRVFASQLGDGGVNTPLAGVTVTVDGMENTLRTVTDANGNFRLDPAPVGRFFVHIDGRTATNAIAPSAYYPYVGKLWETSAGQEATIPDIFLPLIAPGSLQPVSSIQDTVITFPPSVLAAHPELQGVQITVPPDALYSDSGARGGLVGIAPVAPDRLPEPLPPGLNLPLVITVQTDGATNFDRPVPVCFPNLPDPVTERLLGPGEKSGLWSFNHDTGKWEVVGPMQVTDDGSLVCTAPGVGILAPGWHGSEQGNETEAQAETGEDKTEETADCDFFGFDGLVGSCAGYLGGAATIGATIAGITVAPALGAAMTGASILLAFQTIATGNGGVSDALTLVDAVWELAGGVQAQPDSVGGAISVRSVVDPDIPLLELDLKIDWLEVGRGALKEGLGLLGTLLDLNDCGTKVAACLAGASPNLRRLRLSNAGEPQRVFLEAWGTAARPMLNGVSQLLSPDLANHFPNDRRVILVVQEGRLRAYDTNGLPTADVLTGRPLDLALADFINEDFLRSPAFKSTVAPVQGGALAVQALISPSDPRYVAAMEEVTRQLNRYEAALDLTGPRPVRSGVHYSATAVNRSDEPFVRGGAQSASSIEFVSPAESLIKVEAVEAVSGNYGFSFVASTSPGQRLIAPRVVTLSQRDAPDADTDGLSDAAERVIGTDPAAWDTDGDAIPDGAELRQNTNPLDGVPAATGIVTSVVPGLEGVRDIAVADGVAVAALGGRIGLLNVSRAANPVLTSLLETAGSSGAVAVEGTHAAIADGAAGLAIAEVAEPPAARVSTIVPTSALGGEARAVTLAGGVAYVGTSAGTVAAVDVASGAVLDRLSLEHPVQDLAIEKEALYVLTGTGPVARLHAIPLGGGPMAVAGAVESPGFMSPAGRRMRLAVGGGLGYATHTSGFNVFSLVDPLKPVLLHQRRTSQFGWKQIVPNGSGLGVAAVGPNASDDGSHDVSLYDLRNPSATDPFITQFETSGLASAVAIYNGLAYVADGEAGLQVINYRAYDTAGAAPTISLSANFPLDRAEEGKLFRVTANVADDVQVRNVEFYVDGVRVATDGNFPFEYRLLTPRIADRPSFTLSARAFDTGGNSTTTGEFTVAVVADATGPRVTHVSPKEGAYLTNLRAVAAFFAEPIDPASLGGAGFSLSRGGAPVAGGTVAFRPEASGAFLSFPAELLPGRYEARLSTEVTDLAGNPLPQAYSWTFVVYDPTADQDSDGLADGLEEQLGLDPTKADTDGDGVADGAEDRDGDGLSNLAEVRIGTDPSSGDSDGDGTGDFQEDADNDWLSNGEETLDGLDGFVTDPLAADTDGDGMGDGYEFWVGCGLDPTDPSDGPLDIDGDGYSNRQEAERGTFACVPQGAPPAVSGMHPAPDSSGAARNTRVIVAFDREVLDPTLSAPVSTGRVRVLGAGGADVPGTLAIGDDYRFLTFVPAEPLQGGETYVVRVEGIRENNTLEPMSGAFEESFTLGDELDVAPPTVVGVSPGSGASGVPTNTVFTIAFGEPMDPATFLAETQVPSLYLEDRTTGGRPNVMVRMDDSGTIARLVPRAPLAVNRCYQAHATSGIQDAAGNALPVARSWDFCTGLQPDRTGPRVVSTSPVANDTDVPLDAKVVLTFDEPLSPLASGLTVRENGTAVAGSLTLGEANRILTFTPAAPLAPDTPYEVSMSADLVDLSGNRLSNPGAFTFRTGLEIDQAVPEAVAVEPDQGVTGVARSAVLRLWFSERVNPGSIRWVVWDTSSITPTVNAGESATAADRLSASFRPAALLTGETPHVVTVTFRDLSGREGLATWEFTTGFAE